jgi:hypothetical protein
MAIVEWIAECRLWVNRVALAVCRRLPFFPNNGHRQARPASPIRANNGHDAIEGLCSNRLISDLKAHFIGPPQWLTWAMIAARILDRVRKKRYI